MARAQASGITYQKGRGLWKCCVGTHVGNDGKARPRIFWLGHEELDARLQATVYREWWRRMQEQRVAHWTPEQEEHARKLIAYRRAAVAAKYEEAREMVMSFQPSARLLERIDEHLANPMPLTSAPVIAQPAPQPATAAAASPQGKTLYQAIDAYLEAQKGKRVAESHKDRTAKVLKLNLKRVRQDCPLSEIDYLWLDRLCDHYKARPKALKGNKTMRPATVATILRYLRAFFVWIDDTGFGGWEGPRKLLKPFRVKANDLMTSAELRESQQIKQFDVATLTTLYQAASDFQRMLMLMALFRRDAAGVGRHGAGRVRPRRRHPRSSPQQDEGPRPLLAPARVGQAAESGVRWTPK